jgi:hypothetical protein
MQVALVGNATNLSIAAGETVAEALTIASGGAALNLTGYSLKMQIDFFTPLLLTTGNGGITITNASTGSAQINISDTTSSSFRTGGYPYDFWMISGAGVATRLFGGSFLVNQNITPIP